MTDTLLERVDGISTFDWLLICVLVAMVAYTVGYFRALAFSEHTLKAALKAKAGQP